MYIRKSFFYFCNLTAKNNPSFREMQLSTLYICIREYGDVQLYQNSNIDAIGFFLSI